MRAFTMATAIVLVVGLFARLAESKRPEAIVPRIRMPAAKEMLNRLQSSDRWERGKAKYELSNYREELIRGLMPIAEQTKETYEEGDSRQYAVALLADLAARRAIPIFVEDIEYRQSMPALTISPLNGYPCALALRQFGQTGTQGIIVYLMRRPEVSDKAIELYAWVFMEVYDTNAGDSKEAIRVVEGATARALRKEGLQRLLDKLREITKDRVSPFD